MAVYSDTGNHFVVSHVPAEATHILDVGCGCGDNAALIKARKPTVWIEGITLNPFEAIKASTILDRVHQFDLEAGLPNNFNGNFDCLLLSHVLEHLKDPQGTILRLLRHLAPGGTLVIAVPNVLEWRTRFRFLRGDFQYADFGILDRTHLKFFTFETADRELLGDSISANVIAIQKYGDGAVPLWFFRRPKFLQEITRAIDRLGVRVRPNLFAQQIVLVARKPPNSFPK